MAQTDWFAQYKLTSAQHRYVTTVETCLEPEKCSEADQNTKISSENIRRGKSKTGSHPTRGLKSSSRKSATPSTGKRMRQQIHEFKLLYAELDEQASGEAHASYRKCQQQLRAKENLGERVLLTATRAMGMIDGMKKQHASVADKARSLRDQCETLLAEHKRQERIAKNIHAPMKFFEDLTSLGSLLGLPLQAEATLVSPRVAGSYASGKRLDPSSQAFREALHRVSECLAFMDAHPSYQDAADYRAKYFQLQTRALKLMRNKVIDTLRSASASAKAQPALKGDSRPSSFLTRMHNQLIEFRTNARACVPLIRDIESYSAEAEYVEILEDVHECFYEERAAAVSPALGEHLRGLLKPNADKPDAVDVLAFCRAGLATVSQLCHEEYELFFYFFGSVSPSVAATRAQAEISHRHSSAGKGEPKDEHERVQKGTGLFNLLNRWTGAEGEVYSILRPYIINMFSVDQLCNMIQLLKVERHAIAHGSPRIFPAIEPLLSRVNGDTQERLIYRAEIHILEFIQSFKPTPKELDYPTILLNRKANNANVPADRLQEGLWFPTVDRTLRCLGQVYRCVDVGVFEDLAYECVLVCANSLMRTSAEISRVKSPMDAHLFLVRHLLLMKTQLQTFEMDFTFTSAPMLNFDKTRTAFRAAFGKVVDNKASMFTLSKKNSIFEFLQEGIPSVHTQEMDPKKILDEQLKTACRQFIESAVTSLLGADTGDATLQRWLTLECELPPRLSEIRARVATYLDSEVVQLSIYKPVLAKLAIHFSKAEARIKLTDPRAGATTESLQRLRRLVDPEYAPRRDSAALAARVAKAKLKTQTEADSTPAAARPLDTSKAKATDKPRSSVNGESVTTSYPPAVTMAQDRTGAGGNTAEKRESIAVGKDVAKEKDKSSQTVKDETVTANNDHNENVSVNEGKQETASADEDKDKTATANKDKDQTATANKDKDETAPANEDEDETSAANKDKDETAPANEDEDETSAVNEDKDESAPANEDEHQTAPANEATDEAAAAANEDEDATSTANKDEAAAANGDKQETVTANEQKDETLAANENADQHAVANKVQIDEWNILTQKETAYAIPTSEDEEFDF